MRVRDVSVATKLRVVVLGLLTLSLVLAMGLQYRLARVEANLAQQASDFDKRIQLALQWRGATELNVERVVAGVMIDDPALSGFFMERLKQGTAAIADAQTQMVELTQNTPQQPLMEAMNAKRAEVQTQSGLARKLKSEGDTAGAQTQARQNLLPAVQAYLQSMDAIVESIHRQRAELDTEASASRTRAFWMSLGVVLGMFVLGVTLCIALIRSVTQPLDRAVSLAQAIAAGDLNQQLPRDRQDEFGAMLNALSDMTHKLRTLIAEVRSGVDNISLASSEIATGNHDLSARTEQTASNLEETAANMEELTTTLAQADATARQANQLASTAASAAARGGEVVNQVVQSMARITDSSRKIGDIIGVIDSIAFQTNILALNAAVEAARAGEAGRGFAVVATEVRNLAQRSADAAKEIKLLIQTSVDNVQTGSQQVAQAGQNMDEIVSSVQRVSDLISEITASSSEQREEIQQVNQAVGHLDQMTQQNAALVEQSAAAATSMHEQAQRLRQVVEVFSLATEHAQPNGAGHARLPHPQRARHLALGNV